MRSEKKLGSPYTTSFTDGGLEIWDYQLSKMHPDAINFMPLVNIFGSSRSGAKKQFIILFDNNGVVKNCSMSESPVSEKSGLYSQ